MPGGQPGGGGGGWAQVELTDALQVTTLKQTRNKILEKKLHEKLDCGTKLLCSTFIFRLSLFKVKDEQDFCQILKVNKTSAHTFLAISPRQSIHAQYLCARLDQAIRLRRPKQKRFY